MKKITPETYEEMNKEFEEEVFPSVLLSQHKMKSMSGRMNLIERIEQLSKIGPQSNWQSRGSHW